MQCNTRGPAAAPRRSAWPHLALCPGNQPAVARPSAQGGARGRRGPVCSRVLCTSSRAGTPCSPRLADTDAHARRLNRAGISRAACLALLGGHPALPHVARGANPRPPPILLSHHFLRHFLEREHAKLSEFVGSEHRVARERRYSSGSGHHTPQCSRFSPWRRSLSRPR